MTDPSSKTGSTKTESPKSVALTGATGALGRHVLRELVSRGIRTRALRRPGSARSTIDSAGVTWIEGDLDDPRALDELTAGTDAILHLAYSPLDAEPAPGRSPGEHFAEVNLVGTVRLIERTPATRFSQLLFASTLAVHGRAPFARECDEESAVWPAEFYGAHKAGLEKIVRAASSTWNLNTSIWRLGWIVCDYDDPGRDPLTRPLREARDHGAIRDQHASYLIAADDAARMLCDALGDPTTRGGCYHLFDRWFDWNEFAGPLGELLGREIAAEAPPAPAPVPGITRERLASRRPRFATLDAIRTRFSALLDQGH